MCLLPSNLILPTLTFGPSFTTKVMPTAAGGICRTSVRIVANCRPCSESKFFDRDFRLLDARGIVLALNDQSDFVLLEAVENVAIGNRTRAYVADLADRRLFLHLDDDAPALRRLFPQELDVFEVAGVPKGVEVAFQGGGVVDVARLGEDAALIVSAGIRRLPVTLISETTSVCAQARLASPAGESRAASRTAQPDSHSSAKPGEMNEMAPNTAPKRRGLWAQQGSPNESEKESLRPQPLGCEKTVIIR